MSDDADSEPGELSRDDHPVDDAPVLTCSRCDREWSLSFELDTLHAGNQAVEQFAMDHMRHTGHYPDDVTPWLASCRRCPAGEAFLTERPARRWARTHARHTRHAVELKHGEEVSEAVQVPDGTGG